MFWTFVATVFCGLGTAGIALGIRAATRNKAPKWIIPVFAGAGDASVGELARAVQAMRATQTQQMQLLQSLGKQLERLNSEVMKKSDVNLFMPVDSEA